jgi:hypothetical protein
MAACVRIYTTMGKENCITVDSYVVSYISEDISYVTFQDDNDVTLARIKSIVEAGQPCNMHIRYADSDVETVCTLNGCKLVDSQIVCEEHDLKLLGWTG